MCINAIMWYFISVLVHFYMQKHVFTFFSVYTHAVLLCVSTFSILQMNSNQAGAGQGALSFSSFSLLSSNYSIFEHDPCHTARKI